MKKVNVPKTDLHASTLVLGTDYFGSTVGREPSMQLMDRYLEAGGNVIDTAELYARWVPGGEHQSEKVIGEWLRDRGVRDQVILSTKGAHPKFVLPPAQRTRNFRFSWLFVGSELRDSRPSNSLGFFALGLHRQGPAGRLSAAWPAARRSRCVPALLYPPRRHPELRARRFGCQLLL
jgi:Aldo/keto reductase family